MGFHKRAPTNATTVTWDTKTSAGCGSTEIKNLELRLCNRATCPNDTVKMRANVQCKHQKTLPNTHQNLPIHLKYRILSRRFEEKGGKPFPRGNQQKIRTTVLIPCPCGLIRKKENPISLIPLNFVRFFFEDGKFRIQLQIYSTPSL